MKACLFFIILLVTFQVLSQTSLPSIKVNQVGYLSEYPKYAWLTNPDPTIHTEWTVKAEDGTVVKSGAINSSGSYDVANHEYLLRIDFSDLYEPGSYFIEVENMGASYLFSISDTTYNDLFRQSAKAFYYQRSGMELAEEYAGKFSRPGAYFNDGYLYQGFEAGAIVGDSFIYSPKGWFDAADYGKKITSASYPLYYILKSYQLLPDKLKLIQWNLPAAEFNLPDLLNEAKHELDWFFTMQRPDGGVYHLITTSDFHYGLPNTDLSKRYIVSVSSTATGDFAAVMAIASNVFRPFNAAYADSCLSAAEKAWLFLENNPSIVPAGGYVDPPGINNTGGYSDPLDTDERLWAAAELFSVTGEAVYRNYFEAHHSNWNVVYPGSWQTVQNLAKFSYVFATLDEKDNLVHSEIKSEILNYANQTIGKSKSTGYGIALTEWDYYWGSNSVVLTYASELVLAHLLQPNPEYLSVALEHLNYILGTNGLNQCYITGFGSNTITDLHHLISEYDGVEDVIPGLVPGGPNRYSDKWDMPLTKHIEAHNPPPAKCYIDKFGAYSCNEAGVTFNGTVVFLAGYFFQFSEPVVTINPEVKIELKVYPNPAKDKVYIYCESGAIDKTEIFDAAGRLVLITEESEIDISELNKGVYQVRIHHNTKGPSIVQLIKE